MGAERFFEGTKATIFNQLRGFYRLSGAAEQDLIAQTALPVNHRNASEVVKPNYTETEYIQKLMRTNGWTEAQVMEHLGGTREGQAVDDTQIFHK